MVIPFMRRLRTDLMFGISRQGYSRETVSRQGCVYGYFGGWVHRMICLPMIVSACLQMSVCLLHDSNNKTLAPIKTFNLLFAIIYYLMLRKSVKVPAER
jgi:hypothetical protein